MVINKTFAEQFVENCDKDKRVRRIVRMDNVKTLPKENQRRKKETGEHGIAILPKISDKSIGGRRRRIAKDSHTVHRFAERLPLLGWADYCYPIASGMQGVGFPADSEVLGERQVFQQHEDSIIRWFAQGSLLPNLYLPIARSYRLGCQRCGSPLCTYSRVHKYALPKLYAHKPPQE